MNERTDKQQPAVVKTGEYIKWTHRVSVSVYGCVRVTDNSMFLCMDACMCVCVTDNSTFLCVYGCVCVLLTKVHLPLRMFSLLSVGRDMTYKVDWALKTSYLLDFFPVTVLWLHYSFCIYVQKNCPRQTFPASGSNNHWHTFQSAYCPKQYLALLHIFSDFLSTQAHT